MNRKFRIIDAPGWGHTSQNVARIHGYYATLGAATAARKQMGQGALIQESLSGEFDAQDETYCDFAYGTGIAAGYFRNVK